MALRNNGIVILVFALICVGPALLADWLFRSLGLAHLTINLISVGSLMHSGAFLRSVMTVLRPLSRHPVVLFMAVVDMGTRLQAAVLTKTQLLLLEHRQSTVCPLMPVALIPIFVPNAPLIDPLDSMPPSPACMNVLFPLGPIRRNLIMDYSRLLSPRIRLPPRLPAAVMQAPLFT